MEAVTVSDLNYDEARAVFWNLIMSFEWQRGNDARAEHFKAKWLESGTGWNSRIGEIYTIAYTVARDSDFSTHARKFVLVMVYNRMVDAMAEMGNVEDFMGVPFDNHILATIDHVSRHKSKVHDVIIAMGHSVEDSVFYALNDEYWRWASLHNACRVAIRSQSEHAQSARVKLTHS